MSTEEARVFSRAYKLEVIERMDAGESPTSLSDELGIARQLLYRWRDAYCRGGELS